MKNLIYQWFLDLFVSRTTFEFQNFFADHLMIIEQSSTPKKRRRCPFLCLKMYKIGLRIRGVPMTYLIILSHVSNFFKHFTGKYIGPMSFLFAIFRLRREPLDPSRGQFLVRGPRVDNYCATR